MSRELSLLDHALLGLLNRGDASGYELRKVFSQTPLGRFSDSPGSIYPALQRLERRGFVAGSRPTGARRRRTLHLTAAGRRAFTEWVLAPAAASDTERDDGAFELRLAFMSDVAPRRLRAFLDEHAEALDARHDRVAAAVQGLRDKLSPSALLAVDLGLHAMRARSSWCRRATV